jgi:Protein of unknown function (DUF3179)
MLWTAHSTVGYAFWHWRESRVSRRSLILVLLACLALSLFCDIYPISVILPFRRQGTGELALALLVTRFRPVVTASAATAGVLALIGYWRAQPRRWRRAWAAAGAALVVVCAVIAPVNVYELMFHPVMHPTFMAARDVKLDGAEMVLAVRIGGDARAYPIRNISYHHVVDDVVGGSAIVVTY